MLDCSTVTTADLEELLGLWISAEKALTTGQNYSVEGLSVSRVDAQLVFDRIAELRRELCERQQAIYPGQVGVMTPKWT